MGVIRILGLVMVWTMLLPNCVLAGESIAMASEISHRTDKEVYNAGEVVNLELRFPKSHTFFIPQYGLEALPAYLHLQHLGEDEVWRDVQMYADLPEEGPLPTPQLHFWPTSGNTTYRWDQITDYKRKIRAASGRYRFTVVAYTRLQGGVSESRAPFSLGEIDETSLTTTQSNEFFLK